MTMSLGLDSKGPRGPDPRDNLGRGPQRLALPINIIIGPPGKELH